MKWSHWLEEWGMTSLQVNASFLKMEFKPKDGDRDAAWEMYIELLTRVTTQPLPKDYGDEETALASIYSLFGITREIIKKHKRDCLEFTKLAIIILNQRIRPFTAKWHRISVKDGFDQPEVCEEFRRDLEALQEVLIRYTDMLGDIAKIEKSERLTQLEHAT